jgi:hypothetical protein
MVTTVGSEIVVNDTVHDTDDQSSPQVAALSGGGFVETWADVTDPIAFTFDVRAQMFNASGGKVGS